jgi:TolB protein
MNADGSAVVNLTINALDDASAAWSPDGRKIAFYSNRSSRNFYGDVYVMNADGTNPTRLTNTPAQREEKPLWRP